MAMANTKYYTLLTERGAIAVINSQLPIFWNKKVAAEKAKIHSCVVKSIDKHELDFILKSRF